MDNYLLFITIAVFYLMHAEPKRSVNGISEWNLTMFVCIKQTYTKYVYTILNYVCGHSVWFI